MGLFLRLRRNLALRLTAAVALGVATVTVGAGVNVVLREEHELRDVVTKETLLLTRSVKLSFENAIRDRQIADIEATLVGLDALAPRLDIFVVGPHGVVARSHRAVEPPVVPADDRVHFLEDRAKPIAVVHTKLSVPGEDFTGLIVTRPLDAMLLDLSRTRLHVLVTVLASIVASTLLLLLVLHRSVQQPLARMRRAMRHFREAGSSELQEPFADDEVGDALREFAALARELHDTRAKIEQDHETRATLEQSLLRLEKLATVGQLSARVAHEVGSPLQVLEGRLSALARELQNNAPAARLVEIALEQTRRITRVVSQLLTIARPTTAAALECDPGNVAASIAEFLEIDARRRGVKIETELPRTHSVVGVAADHISQIVLNLLRNALEATPKGGHVRLRIARIAGAGGEELHLVVEDTGSGVSLEDRESIFEPFVTTRPETGGTGLGLPIVRSLARRYGGSVTLTSEAGHGARFEVVLPLKGEQHG